MFGKNKCTCRVCGKNEVEYEGAICDLCALGNDPYASGSGNAGGGAGYMGYGSGNGGSGSGYMGYGSENSNNNSGSGYMGFGSGQSGSNNLPDQSGYGGVGPSQDSGVNVFRPGEFMDEPGGGGLSTNTGSYGRTMNKGPITEGIVRNIGIGNEKRSAMVRMLQSIFTGVPYVTDNYVTTFQVYPDQSGNGFNSQGYACDQVILYGKLNAGMINDNNEVEVYGHRDSHNTIIAKKVINRSSGITVTPQHTMPAFVVQAVALLMLVIAIVIVCTLGAKGLLIAAILILCLLNLPLVFKIIGFIFKMLFKLIRMIL